jgi:hypothetical protein
MMQKKRKWDNWKVQADAKRYERERAAVIGPDKPPNSPGSKFAREVLDPAKLPMKPPGVKP